MVLQSWIKQARADTGYDCEKLCKKQVLYRLLISMVHAHLDVRVSLLGPKVWDAILRLSRPV